MKRIACFGEALIDRHPSMSVVAGAPLHVSLLLAQEGWESFLVSKIGDDPDGWSILDHLRRNSVNYDYVDIDDALKTGYSEVQYIDGRHEFTIAENVAWDMISRVPDVDFDLLYYGSVVARSTISRSTLIHLMDTNIKLKFFDLNLRKLYADKEYLKYALNKATHIKVTNEELQFLVMLELFEAKTKDTFSRYPNLKLLAVTSGVSGSSIYACDGMVDMREGKEEILVSNTVGAGDAFSAGLISGLLEDLNLSEIHATAEAKALKFLRSNASHEKIN